MLQTTFADPRVVLSIESNYIPVTLNAVRNCQLASAFKVRIYPTTILIAPDNRILDRIEGCASADDLLKRLAKVQATLDVAQRSKVAR
jgi:hypothetical protein